MAEDMGNPNVAAELAELTDLIQRTVTIDMPKDRKLEIIRDILEDVTDDLKSYRSRWKTATEQAEDEAKQMAESNKEMAVKIKKLEEDERRRVKENEQLEERRRQIDKREEQQDERDRQMDSREERNRLTRTIEHAHVQLEKLKLEEEQRNFQAKAKAAKEANIRNKKRGLGTGPQEEPASKRPCHRRRSSVGSARTLINFGPPAPLPEDILDNIRLPPSSGWVVRHESARRGDDTSPSRTTSTPSGAQGSLGTSFESRSSSSLMNPATPREQIVNPEASSPRTLLRSSQSNPSATDPEGLAQASEEIKSVWAKIEFPENWTPAASCILLRGFKRNIHKNVPKHFRPAGLLDSFSTSPNCLLRRLNKTKSSLDNGDRESCSACKEGNEPCVRVSFVAENDADSRWKLTLLEN